MIHFVGNWQLKSFQITQRLFHYTSETTLEILVNVQTTYNNLYTEQFILNNKIYIFY